MDLTGKVALVTGASGGIGAAVARHLRGQGADVVLADVDVSAGEALADELGATFVRCDVSRMADNEAAMATAVDTYGGVDLVHLNAGISTGCGLGDDFDEARYRRAMSINLDGVAFGVHAALPHLRTRGGGTIIATASMAGLVAVALDPIYAANKHAVVGMCRSLGLAHAPEGIRVMALCPSFAHTAIIADIKDLLDESGFPILDVAEVVAAVDAMLADGNGGDCWFVVPGRTSEPFGFRNAPGPRTGT
ncbi:MAG: SDR family NAD(P)-dependent oxidoreductase [Acidimicrobiia bacterium]|nr:SDR family NAD(P)-dependent oxidoreductase [Acidimicrobiia bacterium]